MKSNDVGDVFLKTGTGKASEIAALLEQRIAAGDYPAGSKLPSERELAASFHVSRNTIRDAIALLAARKIVSTKWGAGTVVLGPDEGAMAIEARLADVSHEWSNIIELRDLVESHVAALAASKATESDLITLNAIIERSNPRMQPKESLHFDMNFHLAVAKSTGNPLVAALLEFVNDSTQSARLKTHETMGLRELSIEGHRRIFDCIRKGDSEGAQFAMEQHLREVGGVVDR